MTESEKEKKFYVGLKNPVSIRRNLLEASKDIIKSLQRYERQREIRKQKIEAIFKVRKLVKDVKRLTSTLNSKLPYMPKAIKRKERKKSEKEKIAPELKKELEKVKATDLKKLDDELRSIEAELNKLSS